MSKGRFHFRIWRRFSLLALSLLATALLASRPAPAATHVLGFEGLPEEISGGPGDVVTFDAYVTLTTLNNETTDGPQGWSYAVALEGPGRLTKFSIDGIKVSTIYEEDPDHNPETPDAIHHDPYEADLAQSFTKIIALCDGERDGKSLGKVGATVIILRAMEKMVLQPSGTQRIGRITVEVKVPDGDGCSPLKLSIFDDGKVTCPIGCGGPHPVITQNGSSMIPSLEELSGQVCVTRFRRGDANGDGLVDISDGIFALNFLFLGGGEPRCKDSADANDDSELDITDCVLIFNRLFNRSAGTEVPPPGIYSCGPDPAADGQSCMDSAGC